MSFTDLVKAYFTHYAIIVYFLLSFLAAFGVFYWAERPLGIALSAIAIVMVYPLVWYLLHRFLLHGTFLYKLPQTASLWKRIHFDHHRDPNDLSVLFGAPYTTIPTIVGVALPLGWIVEGAGGAAGAIAAGLLTTCVYEFCHCVQHFPFTPRWGWLHRVKKLHLAHHYHNEKGNYGITNFLWDRVLGTYYPHPRCVFRSETVFNLGYLGPEAERYPWVARLSASNTGAFAGRQV